jgi:hypothetical protein
LKELECIFFKAFARSANPFPGKKSRSITQGTTQFTAKEKLADHIEEDDRCYDNEEHRASRGIRNTVKQGIQSYYGRKQLSHAPGRSPCVLVILSPASAQERSQMVSQRHVAEHKQNVQNKNM